MVVALAIVAAIGDVGRFEQPRKLVSYLGLNPSVRQSVLGPRITAGSRSRAVGTRAACSSRRLGRQRERQVRCGRSGESRARRGQHVAAVATARKLAVLIGIC